MSNCAFCGGQLSTAGCTNPSCASKLTSMPSPMPFPDKPRGCICPPTCEQTCQSPTCPRKDHTHPDLKWTMGGDPGCGYDPGSGK